MTTRLYSIVLTLLVMQVWCAAEATAKEVPLEKQIEIQFDNDIQLLPIQAEFRAREELRVQIKPAGDVQFRAEIVKINKDGSAGVAVLTVDGRGKDIDVNSAQLPAGGRYGLRLRALGDKEIIIRIDRVAKQPAPREE